MKTPYRVGLTGGIGSGKSTVAGIFANKGVPVIDADEMARKAVMPGTEAFEKIKLLFGQNVITSTGELRREQLRKIVFNDNDKRARLEAIIHPAVYRMIEEAIGQVDYPYCVLSIPLLFETGANLQVDEVIVVDAPEELQIIRTCRRDNVSKESVKQIIITQIDRKKRLELADEIIKNDKGLDYLESQVEILHKKYLKLSKNKSSIVTSN